MLCLRHGSIQQPLNTSICFIELIQCALQLALAVRQAVTCSLGCPVFRVARQELSFGARAQAAPHARKPVAELRNFQRLRFLARIFFHAHTKPGRTFTVPPSLSPSSPNSIHSTLTPTHRLLYLQFSDPI
ncbi:hypothetical protein VTK26DRAFT_1144 [Humicola hyalothermophila]